MENIMKFDEESDNDEEDVEDNEGKSPFFERLKNKIEKCNKEKKGTKDENY
jgi:hypothetical protein